jgi:hypothetical protein
METKEKILYIATKYYGNEERAEIWYETPSLYFTTGFKTEASPKDMVEAGRGLEVLEWLNLILG